MVLLTFNLILESICSTTKEKIFISSPLWGGGGGHKKFSSRHEDVREHSNKVLEIAYSSLGDCSCGFIDFQISN